MNDLIQPIPLPTIRRMPIYLRNLTLLKKSAFDTVSTTDLSDLTGFTSIQIRKDLALTGATGKPRAGYCVDHLIHSIRSFLGWNNVNDAFLVGTGSLGSALLGYGGFEKYGLKITAAFDVNESLWGMKIHDVLIFPLTKLPFLAKRMGIRMGVITVPELSAQLCADMMVESGIEAIWNFAPIALQVPKSVLVQNEDLASGLAILSVKMQKQIHEEIDTIN